MSLSSSTTGVKQVNVVDLLRLLICIEDHHYKFKDLRDPTLSESGRLVASNFSYFRFRNQLLEDHGISIESPLYPPPDSGIIDIIDEASAIIALTQIQGSSLIKLEKFEGAPVLRLSDNPGSFQRAPGTLSDALRTPFIHRAPREAIQQEVEDLSFSTDGGYDDGERENRDLAENEGKDDDDYGEGTASNNEVIRELKYDWSKVENTPYEEFCRFFLIANPNGRGKIRLAGVKVAIERYQAFAIYKAFSQVTRHIYSFIVGDEAGLDKTGTTLIMAAIYAMVFDMWREVKERPDEHLSNTARGNSICPQQSGISAGAGAGRVQCPCVRNSLSRTIVNRLSDLPTIIIAPPGSIPTWVQEAQKITNMAVHVTHSSFEKHPVYFSKSKAPEVMSEVQGDGITIIKTPRNLSRNIVLVSAYGVSKFLNQFDKIDYNYHHYKLCAGLMIFDEFHRYSGGTAAKLTKVFAMLDHLSAYNPDGCPIFAIGVSGVSRSDCAHWRPFVRHAFDAYQYRHEPNITRRTAPLKIAGLTKVQDMDMFIRIWANLVEHLNDPTVQGAALAQQNRDKDSLFNFLREFIPQMIISRRRGDKFLADEIQVSRKIEEVSCPMDDEVRQTLQSTYSGVKSWLNQEYRTALLEWRGNGEEGEKPSKQKIAQSRLEAISDRQKASTVHSRDFQIASRATTFPTVAKLISNETIPYTSLLGKNLRPIATKISNLLPPRPRTDDEHLQVRQVFESSPFFEYVSLLRNESQKYQYLESQINELINIRGKAVDDPDLAPYGPPPPDGTNTRHALVFSDNQFSAFILTMMTWYTYHDKGVEVLYAHGGVNMQTRQSYADYIQKKCNSRDSVKLLVSSIDIMGYGFNLSRANTVILTEIPRRSERQASACRRVDRSSQVMTPKLIQLYDPTNLCEEVRRLRNGNRDDIFDLAKVFQIDDNEDDSEQLDLGGEPGDPDEEL